MAETPLVGVRVPPPLLEAARQNLGMHAERAGDVIRAALAKVGGTELAEHPMGVAGRTRRQDA